MSAERRPPARLTRREFLGLAAASALGAAGLLAGCRRSRAKSVSFLNWAGYIGKETLPRFERETGIIVNYDFYSKEEQMLAKLSSQEGAYDLVVVPDHLIARLAARGLIDPIPHDRFGSLDQLGRRFRDPGYDPGLARSLPYLWGSTGIGVDTARVRERPTSWRALWDERYKGSISMLDNGREAIQCALLVLGLPLDAKEPAQLKKAAEFLVGQRPLLKEYNCSSYADELAAGQLRLAQAWSGDVLVLEAHGKSVDFVVPREGSFMFVDSLCLPRGSAHREQALRLAEYLLRPAIAAEISGATRFATPNEAALRLLDPSLRGDARVYPSETALAGLRMSARLDEETERLWSRTWDVVQG